MLGSCSHESWREAGVGGSLGSARLDALSLSTLIEVADFRILLTPLHRADLTCADLTLGLHVLLNYSSGFVDGFEFLSILLLLRELQSCLLMEGPHLL